MKKLFALICFFAASWAFASPMTEGDFTSYFTKQASGALKDVQFQIIQPLQVKSKDVNGYELTVFLGNAYAQYTSSPANLKSIVDSQIESIRSQRQAMNTKAVSSIFAVIKPADYLSNVKKQLSQAGAGNKELPLVFDRINDDLYVFYVFDSENGMRIITKTDLAEIKIDEKAVHSIATKNLANYFSDKRVSIRRLEKISNAKVYAVSLDENYEASILLLNKYWNKQTFDVSGNIVAFVPARNVVIVTGSQDIEGMRVAGYLAQNGFKELGYAISPKGFVNENGLWKPYRP